MNEKDREQYMMDEKVKQDIKIILDYLWCDEERHYEECGCSKKHIFTTMKRLAKTVKYEY